MGRRGSTWVDVGRCGSTWVDVGRRGSMWVDEGRRGLMWVDVGRCGSGTHISSFCWAEADVKIARMTLTIKLDGNWSSFQLANNTPPLGVPGSVIAPSARMYPFMSVSTPGAVHTCDSVSKVKPLVLAWRSMRPYPKLCQQICVNGNQMQDLRPKAR